MAKLGQGRMPFVGAQRLDVEGLQLLREWIEQSPSRPRQGVSQEVIEHRAVQHAWINDLISGSSTAAENDIIDSLLADTRGAFLLWQCVHEDTLSPTTRERVVDSAVHSENQSVRDLFEWFVPPDARTQRLGETFALSEVLQLPGDAARGRELFANHQSVNCRTCHETRPGQVAIGPSLAGIGKKYKRRELLEQIVDPSAVVAAEFANWLVVTDEGKMLSGLIVSRSEDTFVLKEATGKEHEVFVDGIEVLEQQSQSLMPANLLQSLTAQQAADLLAYLESL